MVGFPKKTIKDIDVHGKTVLMRADYNLPMNKDGTIADDYRILKSLPTLNYLLERDARVIICSHLGRPDGKPDPKFTLAPAAERLGQLLNKHVAFVPECIGDRVKQAVKLLQPGNVLLLENLRFHIEEEKNDPEFSKELATSCGAELFVEDAFGSVHRAHASTFGVTQHLPSVAGFLVEKEVEIITTAMLEPERPLVAILGGAKIDDKIKVIDEFVQKADQIIIGGAMANTFLRYKGLPIGKSLVETDQDEVIKNIYEEANKKLGEGRSVDDFILLPTDVAVAEEIKDDARRSIVSVSDVHREDIILDIGTFSIQAAKEHIKNAATVVWSGTLGYAELPQFAIGSNEVAAEIAASDRTSIIGGGDTVDFALGWDPKKGESFTHVSTGGSASLELMAGDKLPGVEALMDK